tara:strand:+ start:882 stop:1094 length:213 start_codon:yes stop_codon:yes gene_type:complete
MIQELNRKLPRGQRSAFVNKAIRARLDGEEEFDLTNVDTKQLATVLLNRLHYDNNWTHTPLTLMLKEMVE